MFLPSKKLVLPCHKNGYLQSASDARKYRDRFKHNPLAKVADMFIPKPLRAWRWWPCCCGNYGDDCYDCTLGYNGKSPKQVEVVVSGISNNGCTECNNLNGTFILDQTPENPCNYLYYSSTAICGSAENWGFSFIIRPYISNMLCIYYYNVDSLSGATCHAALYNYDFKSYGCNFEELVISGSYNYTKCKKAYPTTFTVTSLW